MPETAYGKTPLPRKLGIRSSSRVLLTGVPADLDLRPIPAGAMVHRRPGVQPYDVIVDFCPDASCARRRFASHVRWLSPSGGLWMAWPKRASGVSTDLTGGRVREMGLEAGLVDVKVCAINDTWSGLRFVRRLTDR